MTYTSYIQRSVKVSISTYTQPYTCMLICVCDRPTAALMEPLTRLLYINT